MKNILVSFVLLLVFSFAYSQSGICDRNVVKRYVKGESVTIECDTVWVMNGRVFRALNDNYRTEKERDSLQRKLNATYNKQLVEGDYRYLILKQNYDSLVLVSRAIAAQNVQYYEKLNGQLFGISDKLERNIETQKNVLHITKKQQRQQFLSKTLTGISGFGLGFALFALFTFVK